MIVKDESHVIRRCLASVRPIIDSWVIVDTGSTDGTQAIVREAMSGLKGVLVERPWRDFAHNRSEALAVARPQATYTIVIDADDELVLDPRFVLPKLTEDSYTVDILDNGTAYRRPQIARNALAWSYRGVLHEFLECSEAKSQDHLPLTIKRNHEGARSRDPQTYAKDAFVLEQALACESDPFLIARYTFYLAQSYRDSRQPEQALANYLARAKLGFWIEEVFVSLLQAGRLMEALGRDVDETLAVYRRASATCPTRAEAAHAASHLLRLKDRFAEGAAIAAPALALQTPPDGLFVERWIYAYGLRDEYAVNAYWAGQYRECLSTCLDMLERADLPDDVRPRVAANARFAAGQLTPAVPELPPPQPSTATASIVAPTALIAETRGAAIEEIVALPARSIVVADVGAAFFGQRQVYDHLLARNLARLVAFEPDEREVAKLRAALGPNAVVVPRALGDGTRQVLYLGPPDSGMTSLLKPDRNRLGFFNGFPSFGEVIGTREIDTVRLDDCPEVDHIDFLRMDIQGAELSVLQNGQTKLQNCAAVQLEVSFAPLYESQPSFGAVDVYLRQQAFLPHCLQELKRWSIAPTIRNGDFRAPFNQLLEGDMVYVKDIIKNEIDDLCLKKIAVVAHYCYRSLDLAARCLLILAERDVVPAGALRLYYEGLAAEG